MTKHLSLAEHMRQCYELTTHSIPPPQRVLDALESRILILPDLELQTHDVQAICRFLSSKKACLYVETLKLTKSAAPTARERRVAIVRGGNYSALNMQGAKILRAVIGFVAKCTSLKSILIDSIYMSPQLLLALASSWAHLTDLTSLIFRAVPVGDDGLRLMTPHLTSATVQYLQLEDCGITDNGVPYICSILRAQEAYQDNLYWNSTLRSTDALRRGNSRLLSDVSGLAALNLTGNFISQRGSDILCSMLRQNQWLLGLNLSNNRIESNGAYQLLDALTTENRECEIIALNLYGNPGYTGDVPARLYQFNCRNEYTSAPLPIQHYLRKWAVEQDITRKHKTRKSNLSSSLRSSRNSTSASTDFVVRHVPDNILSLSNLEDHSTENEDDSTSDVENVKDMLFEHAGPPTSDSILVEEASPKLVDGRPPSRDSIRPRSRKQQYESAAFLGVSELSSDRPATSAGGSRSKKAFSVDDAQRQSATRPRSAPPRGRKMRSRSLDRPHYMQPTAAFQESRAQVALNGTWATTKPSKDRRRAKKRTSNNDVIVNNEMTHFGRDIMHKLSQVVSTVSQDLEAVSGQLRSLTETMTSSMHLSMSRDLSQLREEVVIDDSFMRQSPQKSPHKSPAKSASVEEAEQLTHLIQDRLRKKLSGLLERE